MAKMIPKPLMFAIKRYVFKGILPGHFLTEVIKKEKIAQKSASSFKL